MRPGFTPAAHDARAVVFPAPGGPVITVSGPAAPSATRVSRRGRATIQAGSRGAENLDARTRSSASGRSVRAVARAIIALCSPAVVVPDVIWTSWAAISNTDSLTLFELTRAVPTLVRVIPAAGVPSCVLAGPAPWPAAPPGRVWGSQSSRRSTARSMASDREATPSFW